MQHELMLEAHPVNLTLKTLRQWSENGLLRRLDSAMAEFVREHDPSIEPVALVACALLVHMEGKGHICLSLADIVADPQDVLAWPTKAQADLKALWATLPNELNVWIDALEKSPLVQSLTANQVDQGQPFVLSGSVDKPLLYLRRYWGYEQQVAQSINRRVRSHISVNAASVRQWLDLLFVKVEKKEEETDWQKISCALALRSSLTVITGGPGTGKTYTAARLLALLLAMRNEEVSSEKGDNKVAPLRVALAAPTGKAAARLSQSIAQSLESLQASLGDTIDLKGLIKRIGKASTVHSLLGMRMGSRQFKHNSQHPLDLDVLIVDETSMVNLEMMAALLNAMPADAKLILLGDKDQLASVEAGSVLGDLCAHAQLTRYSASTCDYIQATCGESLDSVQDGSVLDQQTIMLRHSHRFGTVIGELAKAVNSGLVQTPSDQDSLKEPGAYDLLKAQTLDEQKSASQGGGLIYLAPAPVKPSFLLELAIHGRPGAPDSYSNYLNEIKNGPSRNSVGAEVAGDPQLLHTAWVTRVLKAFDRFRFLCAVHDGDWGDKTVNQEVQRALANAGLLKPEGEWFVGRPIMVTRNDKALGVFNGDVGIVLPSQGGSQALRAYFLDGDQLRSVSVSRLAHVETSFAMTIHKSQGSEFSHTVVVLPNLGGDILTRELVYTGITRAKEHLTLIEPQAGLLGEAIAKKVKRVSGLGLSLSS